MSEENETEIIQQDELSADLAAAWEETVEETDDGDDDGIEQPTGEAPPDDQGADDSVDTEASPAEEPIAAESTEPEPAAAVDAPPTGLPPEAREAWKDTPKAMKDAIATREKQFAMGMQKNAEAAKQAHTINQTIAPFGQYVQMNGGPKQAITGLLQTGSALQMGSPIQKAETVANIIKQFGVDINTLDNLLVGQAPPEGVQQHSEVQQAVQQAVQPYQQMMNQMQQAQQQARQQSVAQIDGEIGQFATDNEFYKDVASDMADMLDMAANRGRQMSMQEAYDRACMIHPEISKILQARTNSQQVSQARKAATSISGSPGGEGGTSGDDDMRATIAAAFANSGRA